MSAAKPRRREPSERNSYDFRALLTYRLLVLSNTLGKGAVRLYAGRYGIPLAEWRLLAALALLAPTSVNALSKALSADKGWISRTAASLVERGFAVASENPSDGRRMDIELTAAGRAMYARILPAAVERQRRLVSVLTQAERNALDRILEKLQRQANALLDESATPDDGALTQRRAAGRRALAQKS
jgi:DNA-binding MarR family transcriptional regulator